MFQAIEKGQLRLWRFFHYFSAPPPSYTNGLALNLLHIKYWEKHNLHSYTTIFQDPVVMNEEIGEMALSLLTRKLKVSNTSNQLNRLQKEFSLIPTMRKFTQVFEANFQVEKKRSGKSGMLYLWSSRLILLRFVKIMQFHFSKDSHQDQRKIITPSSGIWTRRLKTSRNCSSWTFFLGYVLSNLPSTQQERGGNTVTKTSGQAWTGTMRTGPTACTRTLKGWRADWVKESIMRIFSQPWPNCLEDQRLKRTALEWTLISKENVLFLGMWSVVPILLNAITTKQVFTYVHYRSILLVVIFWRKLLVSGTPESNSNSNNNNNNKAKQTTTKQNKQQKTGLSFGRLVLGWWLWKTIPPSFFFFFVI